MRVKQVIVAVVVACLLPASLALASGGIYLGNFKITNNGKVVLSDDFHTGKLTGWSVTDATVVFPKPHTTPGLLYLNAHSSFNVGYSASAWHDLNIGSPGLLEMSLDLFVKPAEQQYVWQKKHQDCLAYLKFFTMENQGRAPDQVAQVRVQLNKDEKSCRLYVNSEAGPNAVGGSIDSKTPVLDTGKWVHLVMRMDPGNSTLSLTMDGKFLVSTSYDPTKVPNIGRFGILCAFGDGSQRTD